MSDAQPVETAAIATERPAPKWPHPLTAEQRRKGTEATKRKFALLRAEGKLGQPKAGKPYPGTVLQAESPGFLNARIADIEKEIVRHHKLIAQSVDAKSDHLLATALDKLYQTWSLLTGHERPGVRRAKSRREQINQTPLVVLPKEVGSQ